MKRVLAVLALAAFAPAAALAQGFNTTGGYGNPVLDTHGAAYVNTVGLKPTYSYTAADITPVATATDVVTLTGVTGKVIRVSQVCVSGTATATSVLDTYVYKRLTADTGGTSTTPTFTQHDSNDAAASGVISLYTANPTVTAAPLIRAGHVVLMNVSTPLGLVNPYCMQFGVSSGERIVLRGAAQQLSIGHNGGSIPSGASIYYTIEWSED